MPGVGRSRHHIVVPLIVASALFMQNLSSTALGTSLPVIAGALGEPVLRLHLVLTCYLFSLAVFLPLSGWMADRFGARLVFRAAIATFTLASLLCGLADSFETLILARILQGMGGAMMVPVGRLILVRTVPKAQLVGAIVLMTMPAQLGPLMGPVIGGFLTTYVSWRWVFWINLPLGLVGFALATLFLTEAAAAERRRFDAPGFALAGFGLGATLFGMDAATGATLPPALGLGLLAAGLAACGLYAVHARRTPHPILDLRLLAIPTFRASVVGGSLFRIGVGALPFLLPLLLQTLFQYSAFESGLVTFATAAGSFGMRALTVRILRGVGFRAVLTASALLGGASIAACAWFQPGTAYATMVAVLFVGGLLRSLQFTSSNAIAYADVGTAETSHATSFTAMAQQLALSLGVAVAALVLHAGRDGAGALPADAFAAAFATAGAVSASAALLYLRLPRGTGAELSGRR